MKRKRAGDIVSKKGHGSCHEPHANATSLELYYSLQSFYRSNSAFNKYNEHECEVHTAIGATLKILLGITKEK